MTRTNNGFALPRRVILQGVASVALVGLGKIAFGAAPAFAANDKYPEEAFKQKSVDDADQAAVRQDRPRNPTRSSSTRPRSPRTARWCRSR